MIRLAHDSTLCGCPSRGAADGAKQVNRSRRSLAVPSYWNHLSSGLFVRPWPRAKSQYAVLR